MRESASFQPEEFALRMRIKLREAVEEDLPSLEWWGWFAEHRGIIRTTFAESRRGAGLMIVADSGGFPVAQLWIDLKRKEERGIGILWAVRVIPGFRSLGIGSRLILAAERFLKGAGYSICEIGVDIGNPGARRLYERMGYQITGLMRDERSYLDPNGRGKSVVTEQWVFQKSLTETKASESAA